MKKFFTLMTWWLILIILPTISAQIPIVDLDATSYNLYPKTNRKKPDLPSPFMNKSGEEYIIAFTRDSRYAIIPVTLSNDRDICQQLVVDSLDFTSLANIGLHACEELEEIQTITGRTIDKINQLAKPGNLSEAGFLAEDEDLLSIIKRDNQTVMWLGYTHPDLAKPIFHVLNMMDEDLKLNRWNMTKHEWENIQRFFYHDQIVQVKAFDTKGGQKSIFDDSLEGAFHIQIWKEMTQQELDYLRLNYPHLSSEQIDTLIQKLSMINTGELQPQYIMRYGFYEGHTFWRTDPIAIAYIFGLKSLKKLDEIFNHNLYTILTNHFTEKNHSGVTQ